MTQRREDDQSSIPEAQPLQAGTTGRSVAVWSGLENSPSGWFEEKLLSEAFEKN